MTGCRFSAIGTATLTACALLTWPLAATTKGPDVAPSGTRATRKESELTTTPPSISPNCTRGRSHCGGRSPEPAIRISPPASANTGDTDSMRGPPFVFFLPKIRSEKLIQKYSHYFRRPKCRKRCTTNQAYRPAAISSSTMPVPSGIASNWRTGGGFTMSKARKIIKAAAKDFHARGTAIRATSWPATSSITTNCGSLAPSPRAT